jgi:hypothetical protein
MQTMLRLSIQFENFIRGAQAMGNGAERQAGMLDERGIQY